MGASSERIAVSLQDVAKLFATPSGDVYTAVEGITLDVTEGTFVAIVGPSGCGKSTILNMTAGLAAVSEGSIDVFGHPLNGINDRAAYIFQQDALLPWKTVLDNVLLGPSLRNQNGSEARPRAEEWLTRVGLGGFADHYPYQLSGGMRKRAAIAQNWIIDPDILLMDEPFSALDVQTRQMMEAELLRIWSGSRKTVLFVTHDLEEAISLSDEVVVLSAGPASTVVGRYQVDLERPRDLMDIRTDAGFIDLYKVIWETLREEVLKSYDQSQPSLA
jgi:NitT/TauT family transport system ATP-binding protein